MNKRYNNYHRHSHYSNVSTLDCCVKPIDYINRAKELGHTTYFTTEHSWQGNIFEAYKLCNDNGLKPIYGVEAYYVDDMNIKESRQMYHIILIAMTNSGRKQINKIISKAYKEGFYYKARIDLNCLLSLNPEDVVITTACIATRLFKEDNWLNDFFLPIYNHFGNHLLLEVQDHNQEVQKTLNKQIIALSKEYGVKIIHGCDSHYIYEEEAKIRDMFLKAKGMDYGDEDTFILDYPDYDTILERYREQGVLTEQEAIEALENTLIFDEAEPINLDYEIKLPKIFKGDSKEHLKKIVLEEFKKKIPYKTLSNEELEEYIQALKYEYDIITKCNMEDYFILDYYIVKKAVNEYGGILTRTGRGSGVSFFINYLLGFTQIDRLKSPIKLYPTRFMSTERILSTKSLPDLDLNWANVAPVLKASKDYMGEDGVYYMVAYKPMQEASAFRLWCKALGMHISEYNNVAKNIERYKKTPEWSEIIEGSKAFVGVIESIAPSPCSVLLLDKPISEEIGLIKVGDVMCCALDGYYCDVFKYLKNDYLTVAVYTLISKTYELIGRPIDDISTLINNCDDKVWDLIDNGITTTINQCDSDYDKQILKRYKPRNIAELCAYVASIRPGFASLLNNFVERKPYSTGVDKLDDLLKDSYHYLLYQESIMTYLIWLGIEEKETYDIIKKISKKKFKQKELDELKEKLYVGWMKQVGEEKGFNETWEVVEDASKYSFNASHSLSVALDALYGAYLKANYPLEYFTVALTEYSDDEIRTKNLIKELDYFDIKINPIKFRYSLQDYVMDKEGNAIYKGMASIKYLNKAMSRELYSLRDKEFEDFYSLLSTLQNTVVDSRQLEILIKLDFFSEFGNPNQLLKKVEIFNTYYGRKQFSKDIFTEEQLNKLESYIERITEKQIYISPESTLEIMRLFDDTDNIKTTLQQRIQYQQEHQGYVTIRIPELSDEYKLIQDIDGKYKNKYVTLYTLSTGEKEIIKVKGHTLEDNPISKGDIIKVNLISSERKWSKDENGKWIRIDEYEDILKSYQKLKS